MLQPPAQLQDIRVVPRRRAPGVPQLVVIGVIFVAGLYWLQANPRLWPAPGDDNSRAIEAIENSLSKTPPPGPWRSDEDSSQFSDYALFRSWRAEGTPRPFGLLTVGDAVNFERPRERIRQAASNRERGLRQKQEAASLARSNALYEAERARQAATDQAVKDQYATADAQRAVTSQARDRTAACNTARANAYGTAKSTEAFLAWVRAHPCPEGTDIGDGFWRIAH